MAKTNSFSSAKRGNVSILWALMALPMFVIVGAALDFSRHASATRHLRSAVDAAAIAALRVYVDTGRDASVAVESGQDSFKNNIKHLSEASSITPVITVDAVTGVTVSVSHDVKTTILGIAGIPSLRAKAMARAAARPDSKLEVALVLDTSGSMAGQRLTDLKSAVDGFLDTVMSDTSGRVKVGVVPFHAEVNIGKSNAGASWLDLEPDQTSTYNSCTFDEPATLALGCYTAPHTCTSNIDGKITSYACTTWVCPGGASLVYKDCVANTSTKTWQGCVRSRPYPLDVEDRDYGNRITGFVSEPHHCPTPIQPLTSDRTVLDAHIGSLVAQSETYLAGGIAWGARVLSSYAPFTEGANEAAFAGEGGKKIMILMSDGENTRSPVDSADHYQSGAHTGSDMDDANLRTREACEAAKADGIHVYSIAFGLDDAETMDILEGCATSIENFYDAEDASDLLDAFEDIGMGAREIALVE